MTTPHPRQRFVFNGVDGASGDYLLPPLVPRDIAAIAQGESLDERHLQELKWWHRRVTQTMLGLVEGIDPKNLAATTAAERAAYGHPLSLAQRVLAQYHLAYRELQAVVLGVDDALAGQAPAPGGPPRA